MPFIVAQISDTHLGAGTALFRSNFEQAAAAVTAARPGLVVASGDVSLDGAERETDLVFAAARFAALLPASSTGPLHAVPGNHDVGDHPERAPRQPVTDERLDRFRRHMGPSRWILDRPGWRLLGLDSQVMGAHPAAKAQAGLITEALATLGDRRLAVFIHKPIFTADPAETTFDYWSVPPLARAPLLPLLDHPNLRLVASGHLHLHHRFSRGNVRFVWAPSVAFVVAPGEQPGLPGERVCGALLHRFGDDAVDTELLVPAGMERPFIHEVKAEAYPEPVG